MNVRRHVPTLSVDLYEFLRISHEQGLLLQWQLLTEDVILLTAALGCYMLLGLQYRLIVTLVEHYVSTSWLCLQHLLLHIVA